MSLLDVKRFPVFTLATSVDASRFGSQEQDEEHTILQSAKNPPEDHFMHSTISVVVSMEKID